MKKLTFLVSYLFLSLSVFAQPQLDTAQTHKADRVARRFAGVVKASAARLDSYKSMDSVRLMAASLRKQADAIITEVKLAYKVNDEALSEATNYTNLANKYVNTDPTLATKYLGMAQQKRNESGEPPDYFDALEQIQDAANRLATVKKQERAGKLERRLKDAAHDFAVEAER